MDLVDGLYGAKFDKARACGYCHFHKKALTVKMLRQHECLQKQCKHLEKYEEHEWWNQRALEKQKKKALQQERLRRYGVL